MTGSTTTNGKIVVTGDWGKGIVTRYTPADVARPQMRMYPKRANDVAIPSGAAFLSTALRVLLPDLRNDIVSVLPEKATLDETLSFLELKKWHDSSVLRVSQVVPLVMILAKVDQYAVPNEPVAETDRISILVVHDMTENWWRHSKDDRLQKTIKKAIKDGAHIIVNVGSMLSSNHTDPPDRSKQNSVWESIREHHCRTGKVTIVCSASSLRQAGAAVSRRLSWEQTIEDFMVDLRTFTPLKTLAESGRLVVRFGFVGCLVHEGSRFQGCHQPTELVFAPNAKDGTFRDDIEDGGVLGKNVLMIAAIVDQIQRSISAPNINFVEPARTGLMLAMDLFDDGMPCPTGNKHGKSDANWYDKPAEDRARQAGEISGGVAPDDDRLPGAAYINAYLAKHAFSGTNASPTAEDNKLSRARRGYTECFKSGSKPYLIKPERVLGTVKVPEAIVQVQPGLRPIFGSEFHDTDWQILRQVLNNAKEVGVGLSSSALRINLGVAIVKFGLEHVLNCPLPTSNAPKGARIELFHTLTMACVRDPDCDDALPLLPAQIIKVPQDDRSSSTGKLDPTTEEYTLNPVFVPVLRFADLHAIERREAESIRAIRNLFRSYVESAAPTATQRRPISVAVFGPPGSGKSFAVKQLAESIIKGDKKTIEVIECNVAQFRDLNDLENIFLRCANANVENRVPLVFFDEFDCDHNNSRLGWLKYFLAPMQDGTFYGANRTIFCGRAIFAFAGGVNSSFEKFDPWTSGRGRDPVPAGGTAMTEETFRAAKGPDFVSRLRGHINVLSVNADETGPKDESGRAIKPIIRRAVMLRGHMRKAGLLSESDGISVANVDDDVIFALLTIDSYRHGQRSMEAVLQMCSPIGGRIAIASLPSRAQLKMHVDADEFYTRVLRGRSRKQMQLESLSTQTPPSVPGASEQDKRPQAAQDGDAARGDAVGKVAGGTEGVPSPAPISTEKPAT
jgi:hypothetical protein